MFTDKIPITLYSLTIFAFCCGVWSHLSCLMKKLCDEGAVLIGAQVPVPPAAQPLQLTILKSRYLIMNEMIHYEFIPVGHPCNTGEYTLVTYYSPL